LLLSIILLLSPIVNAIDVFVDPEIAHIDFYSGESFSFNITLTTNEPVTIKLIPNVVDGILVTYSNNNFILTNFAIITVFVSTSEYLLPGDYNIETKYEATPYSSSSGSGGSQQITATGTMGKIEVPPEVPPVEEDKPVVVVNETTNETTNPNDSLSGNVEDSFSWSIDNILLLSIIFIITILIILYIIRRMKKKKEVESNVRSEEERQEEKRE
jgi:hypothetical protein